MTRRGLFAALLAPLAALFRPVSAKGLRADQRAVLRAHQKILARRKRFGALHGWRHDVEIK